MQTDRRNGMGAGVRVLGVGLAAMLGMLVATGLRARAQEQDPDSAGIVASGKATPHDVGLPFYPGAKLYKKDNDDSDAARLGLWGGGYDFKLVVVKMKSDDAPGKIAAFYKKALAKYGTVLDCTNGGGQASRSGDNDSSQSVTCDDDKPDKGGMLFKAGAKKDQHLVAVEPQSHGTVFDLVYVYAEGK
jgi:hypothetical protein